MIANIRNAHARKLCTLAAGDEAALQYPLPDYIYGFHAQQACEKLLKALIASHNTVYPFTHNLVDLALLASQSGEALIPLPCGWTTLEQYGVLLRYDFGPTLDATERQAFRDTVAKLRDHVVARILDLEK